jgi:hypothetical protein
MQFTTISKVSLTSEAPITLQEDGEIIAGHLKRRLLTSLIRENFAFGAAWYQFIGSNQSLLHDNESIGLLDDDLIDVQLELKVNCDGEQNRFVGIGQLFSADLKYSANIYGSQNVGAAIVNVGHSKSAQLDMVSGEALLDSLRRSIKSLADEIRK